MSGKSKNDIAWERLFDTDRILDRVDAVGVCEISRASIIAIRDARLMTSFEHHIQLPSIFKQHRLSVHPNSRDSYLIGRFDSYFDLPAKDESVEAISFPVNLDTIDPADLYSESSVLLCAYNTGLLNRLLNEAVSLTAAGPMFTGRFDYFIRDLKTGGRSQIQVEDSACAIDGGFEGADTFLMVKVKNETVEDLLIRQLYYPYRLWSKRTRKQIVPAFLSYSGDVFSFYLFRFTDLSDYNSIELIDQKNFQIGTSDIEISDLMIALDRSRMVEDPEDVPFPQADNFNRVIDLLGRIHIAGSLSQEDITTNYAFDLRQTQYYADAARYLGLLGKDRTPEGVNYSLTHTGISIMTRRPAARNLALAEAILAHSVFNKIVRIYLEDVARPFP